MNRRTLLGIGLAVAVVLAIGSATVSGGPAQARGDAGAAKMVATGGASAMSHMIVCTPHVDPPYRSGYLILTVTVLANVSCVKELDDGSIVFAPVDLIDMDVNLTKFGPPGAGTSSEHFHATHASYLRGHATRFCNEGWYQGWITVHVTFPAGYNPPSLTRNFPGPDVYITCAD